MPKQEIDYKKDWQMVLFEKDYNILQEHHEEIFAEMNRQLEAGLSAAHLIQWAKEVVVEPVLLSRIKNGVKYAEYLRKGSR